MNRFWGHTLSTAVLAVAAGSAIPACAHDDASLFVHGVLAPPLPNGSTCIYVPDPTAVFLARGEVDGALTDNYSPEILIASTLVAQGNATKPNSETARIEIQGALVRVVDPTDNSEWMNNTVLTAGILEPSAGTQPSYTAISVSIMDAKAITHFTPPTRKSPSKVAIVYVTFFGQTLGGQNIQSNQFQFPVDVCDGCLVAFPPNAAALKYCEGTVPAVGNVSACIPGQDQPIDCQKCFGNPVCNDP